ncbi:hypothetical protein SNEBB_004123 [Seison nebaliae]|nr:hypothetical protein SNEBB_004123 [Seison nebaliae]
MKWPDTFQNEKCLNYFDEVQTKIDHFSFDGDAFNMRIIIDTEWWRDGNDPVYFYAGNEGFIELFCENAGFMWYLAEKRHAMVIFAEHRYYGKSLPFGNESFSSPDHTRYLTIEQTLADYAIFLKFTLTDLLIKRGYAPEIAQMDRKNVVFGGSYGGMLAAWMRMKYPTVVDVAIAASAPIWQFPKLTSCGAFSNIVTKTFNDSDVSPNKTCIKLIKSSWKLIDKTTPEKLQKIFRMCDTPNRESSKREFKDYLNDAYGNLAMIDYPYAATFLADLPPWPVKEVCSAMTNSKMENDDNVLEAIANGIFIYTNYSGGAGKCFNYTDSNPSGLGDDAWDYQSCTEIVMPMCSNGSSDMFEPIEWDFQKYSEECQRKWEIIPDPDWLRLEFGGKDLSPYSNIFFSNGDLDPWSGGGVTKSPSPYDLPIALIKQGAHHYDLRGPNDADTQYVKSARDAEEQFIQIKLSQL